MVWICNVFCKVSFEKILKVFILMLIVNICNEIDYNGVVFDWSSGIEVFFCDWVFVWYVSMFLMCVVYVGGEVLMYKDDFFGIVEYM